MCRGRTRTGSLWRDVGRGRVEGHGCLAVVGGLTGELRSSARLNVGHATYKYQYGDDRGDDGEVGRFPGIFFEESHGCLLIDPHASK